MINNQANVCSFTNASSLSDIQVTAQCEHSALSNTRSWPKETHDVMAYGLQHFFGQKLPEHHRIYIYACAGCKSNVGQFSRRHNRVEGECRFFSTPESSWEPEWSCPGCSYKTASGLLRPRPRGHPSHSDDENCRYTAMRGSDGTHNRNRPFPRDAGIPAEESSHANASAGDPLNLQTTAQQLRHRQGQRQLAEDQTWSHDIQKKNRQAQTYKRLVGPSSM